MEPEAKRFHEPERFRRPVFREMRGERDHHPHPLFAKEGVAEGRGSSSKTKTVEGEASFPLPTCRDYRISQKNCPID
jgi:hypothetical protein